MRKIDLRISIPRVLPWVLLCLLTPTARAAVSQDDIASWQGTLAAIDTSLRAGEWGSAETAAEELVDAMIEADPSRDLSVLVSVAVLSQALAEAGVGERDDARWHWTVAQNLNPRLRRARFPAYGEAGEFLEEHPLRRAGAAPAGLSPVPIDASVEPPSIDAPDGIPEAWSRFELVVTGDGSVHAPVLVVPDRPAATIEALEGLRDLKLEPARSGGEAVAVYWRPRPEIWVIHSAGDPAGDGTEMRGEPDRRLEESLAACSALGTVMETSGATGTWPGSPFRGPHPGMVETLERKAVREGADTLILDNYDDAGVKGRAFRCGADWYPPHLAAAGL